MKKLTPISIQIRDARQLAGLSQEQLAAKLGISRPFLAKMETGAEDAVNPTLSLILALELVLKLGWVGPNLQAHLRERRKKLTQEAISAKTPRKKSQSAKH